MRLEERLRVGKGDSCLLHNTKRVEFALGQLPTSDLGSAAYDIYDMHALSIPSPVRFGQPCWVIWVPGSVDFKRCNWGTPARRRHLVGGVPQLHRPHLSSLQALSASQ